ncbi:MAG: ATP-grasp domain-containing protein [Anaerolineaceae bacterium]|nr:ATP-grasp domain-containing protein [Anaerolineaceae bacterium]
MNNSGEELPFEAKLMTTIRREMEIALIKSYTEKPWRSPETYQLMEDSLREKWHVTSINTKNPDTLYSFLFGLKRKRGENIFVFNIAEYLDEKNKTGFLPSLLEEWKIPHLGSSAEAIAVGLDKARTKELLGEKQIPTPRYFVANREDSDIQHNAERIGYPLIVKPISEGGHIGIREDSIVYNEADLEKVVNRIFDTYDQPALVEEFITGEGMREFSVGIIDSEINLFTPIEIDYESMDVEKKILSYEAAQKDLERTKPVQDEKIYDEIIDLSKRTFAAVGARDYSRVDLRMNHSGCYVLEINIMPGLGPHSFLPEAAKIIHGLEYDQLIQKLAEDSIQRQKKGR